MVNSAEWNEYTWPTGQKVWAKFSEDFTGTVQFEIDGNQYLFSGSPTVCKDQGGILGGATWECDLPVGHTGPHRCKGLASWK